ncbi:MAG: gamma-glutamyltransferase [Aureliella sp.]
MHRRQFAQLLASATLATCSAPRALRAQQLQARQTTVARGRRAAAATVHPLATEAAMTAFARGGNAVDAAVAASLMLSVVDIHNSGLGGGGLALVRTPSGKVVALDGRERAPLAATPQTFMRGGKADPALSQTGPLAVATPGLPVLLEKMAEWFGAVDWQNSLEYAAKIAEAGFAIDAPMARNLASNAEALKKFPESARVLLGDSGKPPAIGELLVQKDLARTLRRLALLGTEWFYDGEFSQKTAALMQQTGGLLSADDFAKYELVKRQPIECSYRGNRVLGFPPPSSGGIHVAQMLTMLSAYDVRAIFERSEARGLHLLVEVMKRAMADRAQWLGDGDFVGVPRGLLDPEYLAARAADIDLERSTPVAGAGTPPRAAEDLFAPGKHTTHLTTADEEGYVVALTQTINTSFGSKVMVPGTGVLLNNEMDDFSLAPGVRNAFGLVGSAANAVAPGKRPLSSMSPTIVVNADGNFLLTCGAAGGPKIITAVLQTLVRTLDLGQSIDAALAAPRVHHQWSPDTLAYEASLPEAVVHSLQQMGHTLQRGQTLGVAQGIQRTAEGQFLAASDPRVPSSAAAKG